VKAWIKYFWDARLVYVGNVLRKIGIRVRYTITANANPNPNPGSPSYLFNWGIYIMLNKYEKANIEKWWTACFR
jgi:hypothetical protein